MKLIKAYIRFRMVGQVYEALKTEGYVSMTFVECEGTGKYSNHEKAYISDKFPGDANPVIKLEILIKKKDTSRIVDLIRKSARTGYRGDGMILISNVESVFKIRTDDEGFEVI